MIAVRRIQNDVELLKALKLSAKAFMENDPLFLSNKVPIDDFISYYYSIKNTIMNSPFSYALYFNNEIKARFIGLPTIFTYTHEIPKSMEYYDEFFGKKYEEHMKLINKEKCFYPVFTASFYKGGAKLLYTKLFKDLRKEGFNEMYYEMSNPINTKVFHRYGNEANWNKMEKLSDEYYKDKIKVEFYKAKFNERLIPIAKPNTKNWV